MVRPNSISFSLARETLLPYGVVAELTKPVVLSDASTAVDIWCVGLHQPRQRTSQLKSLLPDAERAQGMRLRSAAERRRFLVRRAARRLVLSRYLGRSAEVLDFAEDEMGKPVLTCSRELQFNCSASSHLALIAVIVGRRVGVDVEQLRAIPDALDIANGFFSRSELEALRKVPSPERSAAFLRLWTCKEAWTKATGTGLSLPLDRFDIQCDPLPQLRRIDGAPLELRRWRLQSFVPAPGFIGAVAVEMFGMNEVALRPGHALQQWGTESPAR